MESALLHSSMLMADNTTWYHGGHPIKGVRTSPYSGVPNSQAGVIISPAQTDGLTVLATGQRQYAKLVHYQPSYNTAHTMKQ